MTERLEERARAFERLAWKRSGTNTSGRDIFREDEIEDARRDLRGTLPILIDRERSRRDVALRQAAGSVADALNAGIDLDGGVGLERGVKIHELMEVAKYHDEVVNRLEDIAAEKRAVLDVSVRREPRVYRPDGDHSYLIDLARSALPGSQEHVDAVARLDRHSHEVGREAALGTPEGLRALRVASTRGRDRGEEAVRSEVRAMTTGATSGGSFVTPAHMVENWAKFRTYGPALTLQTTQLEDPGFGMELFIPAFTQPADVGIQGAENTGVTTSAPDSHYLSVELVTIVGEIPVSQQLFDRAGPMNFDVVGYAQLQEQINTAMDEYVIAQALANAGTIAGASSFSVPALFQDIAKAKAAMLTEAGTVIPATHIFMQPTFAEWAMSKSDTSDRPLMTPAPECAVLPITPGPGGSGPEGFTGTRLLSTAVFEDGNIPTASGTKTQIIVANAAEIFTLASEPALRAFPETLADDLTVIIQAYRLVGAIVRYPEAVQVITGDAYVPSPSFL